MCLKVTKAVRTEVSRFFPSADGILHRPLAVELIQAYINFVCEKKKVKKASSLVSVLRTPFHFFITTPTKDSNGNIH